MKLKINISVGDCTRSEIVTVEDADLQGIPEGQRDEVFRSYAQHIVDYGGIVQVDWEVIEDITPPKKRRTKP